jgi:hypothetical protein
VESKRTTDGRTWYEKMVSCKDAVNNKMVVGNFFRFKVVAFSVMGIVNPSGCIVGSGRERAG